MSPNGRRAWRRAAKKLRRKMGRKWHCSKDDRGHNRGAWFKRHGFTEQGLQKLDSPHPVRVYIGLWGTANGDGVMYAVKPKPFTARSLVGMTMGARKRNGLTPDLILQDYYLDLRLRPCPGCEECRGYDDGIGVLHCDGSGVLPARKEKS